MKKLLCIVAIVKNEAPYILEWIAHYRASGAREIFILDNQSTDQTSPILQRMAEKEIIQLKRWEVSEGVSPQLSGYSYALTTLRDSFEFLAFFDADEFLTPRTNLEISEWLSSLDRCVGAVAINQRVFGSSGRKEFEPGLVIDRFRQAAIEGYEENRWVKSIYRASVAADIYDCHRGAISAGRYILPCGIDAFSPDNKSGKAETIDFSMFQLNHYILKSQEEFLIKRKRGGGMGTTLSLRMERYVDINFFHGRNVNINRVADETLAYRLPSIRRELAILQELMD